MGENLHTVESARAEARGLYRMLGHDGNTVEAIRELIGVPPKIERVLLAFARARPEEAHCNEKTLKFRQEVESSSACCATAFQLANCRKWKNRS